MRRTYLPEYRVWWGIKTRCYNHNHNHYKRYGGRGIKICPEWLDFDNFYRDMGQRPTEKHQIDRIDNNGDYEPTNCRWVLRNEQSRNQGNCIYLNYNGELKHIADWAKTLGMKRMTLYMRIRRGWSIANVLSPLRRKAGNND